MQKDKSKARLKTMLAIKDGKSTGRTTPKSAFNRTLEANRPTHTYDRRAPKGRMLTQYEMHRLRRMEQIWPDDIQTDADRMRNFNVH